MCKKGYTARVQYYIYRHQQVKISTSIRFDIVTAHHIIV
jgi:hypothetical protein